MIRLSNGHVFQYMVASGALSFNGQGWLWERPLVWFGLIKPELFTVVLKTLTRHPRKGNLRWWKPWTWLPFSPWSCVRFVPGGVVNKVGLTNDGIDWWCRKIGPKLNFAKYPLVASIFGTKEEMVEMALILNKYNFVALEVNPSCPNTGQALSSPELVIEFVKAVKQVSRHPIIIKVSVSQDYLSIAKGLEGIAEAIALNSVPWNIAYPDKKTPLAKLEKKVQGGGGGVSGKPAQKENWKAVKLLSIQNSLRVIGPSIMEFDDLEKLKILGASVFSFGATHVQHPMLPTTIVERHLKNAN